jgi:protocatechuate 3,4-dioxygenase beta subunit
VVGEDKGLKMHKDDRPIGRLLNRREALAPAFAVGFGVAGLFGASAASLAPRAVAQTSRVDPVLGVPDCVAQPEQTEGPYFVDKALERSDIRLDPVTGRVTAGAPLALQFVLSSMTPTGACMALPRAQVDIWHCDAAGRYSDVADRNSDTRGQQFLRGYQVSDAAGAVRFTTIYPGWYRGRAVHIHFKVRVPGQGGRTDEFTSQLYFSDELTDRVHAAQPYAANKGQRLLNARDMIFREGGTQLILPVVENDDGYEATYRIAMRPGQSRAVPARHRESGRS